MVGKYRTSKRRQISVGVLYGRLTVRSFAGRNEHGNLMWNCICVCGVKKKVLGSNLLSGTEPSCGCFKHDILLKRNTTHGQSCRPEYKIWLGMKARCFCETNQDYDYYGGRGITVCDRWLDFVVFYKDMGPRPSNLHTLERKNNDADYFPGNCEWATRTVQSRNKSNVPLFEYNGEKKSLAEWSELCGIHSNTLRSRIRKGWSMRKTLTKPIRPIKGVHY